MTHTTQNLSLGHSCSDHICYAVIHECLHLCHSVYSNIAPFTLLSLWTRINLKHICTILHQPKPWHFKSNESWLMKSFSLVFRRIWYMKYIAHFCLQNWTTAHIWHHSYYVAVIQLVHLLYTTLLLTPLLPHNGHPLHTWHAHLYISEVVTH